MLVGIFCHWLERGLEGRFSVHLLLMFSFLCTGTHHDRKTIAVSQGLPDGIDQLLSADKVQLGAKMLLVPSLGSCSSTAFSNS